MRASRNRFGLTLGFILLLVNAGPPPPAAVVSLRTGMEGPRACSMKARLLDAGMPPTAATVGDPSINVSYYRLNLTPHVPSHSLKGIVTVKAVVVSDSVSSVDLDLVNTMVVDSVVGGSTRLSFQQYPLALKVVLDRAYRRDEVISFDVYYGGTPRPTGFGSFEFSAHAGTPWIWSLSEPYGARDWWPCKDHQSDKADSVDVLVTCDTAWKVGSNGVLAGVALNGDGTKTVHWSERYPIATYLVSVAITNYAEFSNWFHYDAADSMQILNYVLPEHLADALAQLPKTVGMLQIFSRLYGAYPFIREKYGHSEFGLGGAMEHQTMTSTTTFDEDVIAHELAHQWFGDLITCADWPDLWLNEGFATYSEALYREAAYGEDGYWQLMNIWLADAQRAVGPLRVADTTDVRTLFDETRVYAKGACVLHMLRHILGDSTFFRTLRAYAADPRLRYGTATTSDFENVCEQVSGQDLGYFFSEWIDGESYPRYAVRWQSKPGPSGTDVIIRLDQSTNTQNPPFFIMPVDCELRTQTWDTTVTLLHQFSGQQFAVTVSHSPDSVLVDPAHWILRDFFPANPVLPVTYGLDQNFPNPFNPATSIRFRVPHRGVVTIEIFNILGEKVAVLLHARREAGEYTVAWDGRGNGGNMAPSGVYLCRFTADQFSATKKMLLVR